MAKAKKKTKKKTPATPKRRAPARPTKVTGTRRRRYKKNPSNPFVLLASAIAGFILAPKALDMIPKVPAMGKNLGGIAAGAYAATSKHGKKNSVIMGLGIGLAGGAAKNLVTQYVPQLAGDGLTHDEQRLLADHINQRGVDGNNYLEHPENAASVLGEVVDFSGGDGVGEIVDFQGAEMTANDFNQILI